MRSRNPPDATGSARSSSRRPDGRSVETALATVDFLDTQLAVLDRELRRYARADPATQALDRLYGVGDLTAVAIYAAVGDARRFSSARKVIRLAGLDVGRARVGRQAPAGPD